MINWDGPPSSQKHVQLAGTWWLIPLSKWVITPVLSGLPLLIPFVTGVISHLRAVGSSPPNSNVENTPGPMVGLPLLDAHPTS